MNSLKSKKILFLYTGGHSVHLAFAKSIGADIQKMSWKVPRGYDIYISEGNYLRTTLLRKFGILKSDSKVINLFADPRLYYLRTDEFFDSKSRTVKKYPYWKKRFSLWLLKEINGAICVGAMVKDSFRYFEKDIPCLITSSFVSSDRIKFLRNLRIKNSGWKIIFIGNGPDYHYKGLDLLEKSFLLAREKMKDIELIIIGGGWDNFGKDGDGISYVGYQEDISKYMEEASLMIHLGRGDTFPTNTLESVMAGIPLIVSSETGTRAIVEKIDPTFVLPLDENKVADKIVDYFNSGIAYRGKMSARFKKMSGGYSEEEVIQDFEKRFWRFLKEIYTK